ncbi:MAG: hypothetical protein E5X55_34850, partial [Mesorhizobium sp.]
EMQCLRQRLEILHLPDGETNHKQNLSQQTGKAICFYRQCGLVWNHSRMAWLRARRENQQIPGKSTIPENDKSERTMDAKTDDTSAGKCPVVHTTIARANRDWWPNQLNVQVLHQQS